MFGARVLILVCLFVSSCAMTDEQKWFTIFRLGIWPEFFPG
jgi:hypothetical protein